MGLPAVFPMIRSGKLVAPLMGPMTGGLEEGWRLSTMRPTFEVVGIYLPATKSQALNLKLVQTRKR